MPSTILRLIPALAAVALLFAPMKQAHAAACTAQTSQNRDIMREALSDVAKRGLRGKHHYSITFVTKAENVQVPGAQRELFPDQMSIILQHQFEKLKVTPDRFEVRLWFKGKPARIVVPFEAVTLFVDPSVNARIEADPASIGLRCQRA